MHNRFKIQESSFGTLKVVSLIDELDKTVFQVLPDIGGALHSLCIHHKGKNVNLISNYTSSYQANKEIGTNYKGAKLFPFANRVLDGSYTWESNKYQLKLNSSCQNAHHGLVYNQPFAVTRKEVTSEYALLVLSFIDSGKNDGYPFEYKIDLQFELRASNLINITTRITNLSSTAIPYSDGWHPYFQMDALIDDCYLSIPSEKYFALNERMVPTGCFDSKTLFSSENPIGKTTIDNCYVLEDKVIDLINTDQNLTLRLIQDMDSYPYLHVYTPDNRKSIALEPCTAPGDSFNNDLGLRSIDPSETIELNFSLQVFTDQLS